MNDHSDSQPDSSIPVWRYGLAAGWAILIVLLYAIRQISLHWPYIEPLLNDIR